MPICPALHCLEQRRVARSMIKDWIALGTFPMISPRGELESPLSLENIHYWQRRACVELFLLIMVDIYFREHHCIPLSFSQQGSVKALSFSNDGRYLAIGYGGGADVWDLEDNSRNSPLLTTHRRSPHPPLIGLAWFPHQSRIVLAHCNGIVYTLNVTKRKFSTAGIRSNGFHEDAVLVAILDDTVFVVAFKTSIQVLEIRPGSEDTEDELVLLGYLRSPPAAAGLDGVGDYNGPFQYKCFGNFSCLWCNLRSLRKW
ncbi:hypothetical protein BDP27DRAFT_1373336 [Rhodocollybia butyracea]|uniref:Uncharacterized protein n=1 Tax=Rhodocollybia butyracea TaxID=206335 RepID=A0A9P5TX77_9AGAR|nr:hypothetical protein BDP27DRAFT_1373336 [Rhodocollybia butyracea]